MVEDTTFLSFCQVQRFLRITLDIALTWCVSQSTAWAAEAYVPSNEPARLSGGKDFRRTAYHTSLCFFLHLSFKIDSVRRSLESHLEIKPPTPL